VVRQCWRMQTAEKDGKIETKKRKREREKHKSREIESLVEKERQSLHPPATPPECDSAVQLTRAHWRLH